MGRNIWDTRIHDKGFLGFVDRFWLFWTRVSTILIIFSIIVSLIVTFVTWVNTFCDKESYSYKAVSRLRNAMQSEV